MGVGSNPTPDNFCDNSFVSCINRNMTDKKVMHHIKTTYQSKSTSFILSRLLKGVFQGSYSLALIGSARKFSSQMCSTEDKYMVNSLEFKEIQVFRQIFSIF